MQTETTGETQELRLTGGREKRGQRRRRGERRRGRKSTM